jgi:hypothetical protein
MCLYHRLALVGCPGISARVTDLPSMLLFTVWFLFIATATHTRVHDNILTQGVLGDAVILVDEGVDLLILVVVSLHRDLGDIVECRQVISITA